MSCYSPYIHVNSHVLLQHIYTRELSCPATAHIYTWNLLSCYSPYIHMNSHVLLQPMHTREPSCPVAPHIYTWTLMSCCSPYIHMNSHVLLQPIYTCELSCPATAHIYMWTLMSCYSPYIHVNSHVLLQPIYTCELSCPATAHIYTWTLRKNHPSVVSNSKGKKKEKHPSDKTREIRNIQLVLIITCLEGRFGINCPSAFLKMLKIFKNYAGDLSQKLPEQNVWLLVNHTKPTNTLYWN